MFVGPTGPGRAGSPACFVFMSLNEGVFVAVLERGRFEWGRLALNDEVCEIPHLAGDRNVGDVGEIGRS